MYEKTVDLVAWLQNPALNWDAEDSSVAGALGCFEEKNSKNVHNFYKTKKNPYGQKKLGWNDAKELIMKESAGRGHGSVMDQSVFLFSIDNLTRASTLFLCSPEYASHLQQSLRRVTAERGFYLDKTLEDTKAEEIMKKQFSLYTKMQEAGIPSEDARYILPLATKTAIQTLVDARELMHMHSMANREGVSDEVKDTINKMYEKASQIAPALMKNRGTNYEVLSWFPSSQLFSLSNKGLESIIKNQDYPEKTAMLGSDSLTQDSSLIKEAIQNRDEAELANLKHYHFTLLAPMSLATFHQMTRQRTLNQSVESLGNSVLRGNYVIPSSIKNSEFKEDYNKLNEETISFVKKNLDNPNSLSVIPHSLQVYDLLHVNGWNALGFIAKRTCNEAQWEIRKIAKDIAGEIKNKTPNLGKFAVPQGILYGKCPEKKSCGYCDNKTLEDL